MAYDRDELMRRYAPRLIQEPAAAQEERPAPAALTPSHLWTPKVVTSPETTGTTVTVSMPPAAQATLALWKPVVTTAGNRTILTAPATVERAAMWDTIPNPNPHMLWMQGRFVGADRPNRNGAYWSSQDLEMGKPTVAHGPLNWLHQDRHVIGTIADATFVATSQVEDDEQDKSGEKSDYRAALANGAGADVPIPDAHISALAGIWRWIYPDEASVVEMASENGVLAYSMECIAEAVECVGENGCGQQYAYLQYCQGQICSHLQERASVRRLVNPTFLGGAVIVPPTRPGWADANATVMKQAAAMAEKAYDQAGRPDIPATTWEQMMAGVVTFTGTDPS